MSIHYYYLCTCCFWCWCNAGVPIALLSFERSCLCFCPLGGAAILSLGLPFYTPVTPQLLDNSYKLHIGFPCRRYLVDSPLLLCPAAASVSFSPGESEGARPGDLVHLDGSCPPATYPKVLKLDDWRKVVSGLVVRGGKATFEGTPFMTSAGVVTVPGEIVEGSGIH
jgi:hypothetical protein